MKYEDYFRPNSEELIREYKRKKHIVYAVLGVVAAALAVFACIKIVDAYRYSKAEAFMKDHCLSIEGLTKEEILEIRRDVTEGSFAFAKTADVLSLRLDEDHFHAWADEVSADSPESVKLAWERLERIENERVSFRVHADREAYKAEETTEDSIDGFSFDDDNDDGFYIEYDGEYEDGELYGELYYVIEKYLGEELIWSYQTKDMQIHSAVQTSDGVLAFGSIEVKYSLDFVASNTVLEGSSYDFYSYDAVDPDGSISIELDMDTPLAVVPAVMKLSDEGELVWMTDESEFADIESIYGAVENEDGTITLITDTNYYSEPSQMMGIVRIDKEGKKLDTVTAPVSADYWYCYDIVSFDGGYAAVMYDGKTNTDRIVTISPNGAIKFWNELENGSDTMDTEIAVVDGKLFIWYGVLSEGRFSKLAELKNEGEEITDEELVEAAREELSIKVFIAEKADEIEHIYTIEGADVYTSSVVHGKLQLYAGEVVSVDFVDYQLFDRIGVGRGALTVYNERVVKYTFSSDGSFLNRVETEEECARFHCTDSQRTIDN